MICETCADAADYQMTNHCDSVGCTCQHRVSVPLNTEKE
jgi:hypothetical protein